MSVSLPRPIVTLTTDFGSDSSYVAQMKGVILSRNPDICLVDISHSISPQDLCSGALVLADACPRFPARTIHIAVVDPGVGTDRRIIFAQIGTHRFIAPDNGLLTLIAQRTVPSQIIDVRNRLYFLPTVSPTFHGRDVMAPVAAHLSLGLNPQRLGESLESLVMLPFPKPIADDRRIRGEVIQIDVFGNLITNITTEEVGPLAVSGEIIVQCKSATMTGIAPTYGSEAPGSLIALIGSSGRLELAVVNGNAAAKLSAVVGEAVSVECR